jgi:hypothetical protein
MYLECHGARVLNDHDLQGLETRMKEPDVTRSVILVDASVCNSPSALLDLTTRLSREHSVWVLLKPEERREHRKLMEGGNIGYLVKPVRYATLRQQLGISDAGKQAMSARCDRRQPAFAAARYCGSCLSRTIRSIECWRRRFCSLPATT